MVWHVFSAAGFGVCDERTHPEAVFYLNIQGSFLAGNLQWMMNEQWSGGHMAKQTNEW